MIAPTGQIREHAGTAVAARIGHFDENSPRLVEAINPKEAEIQTFEAIRATRVVDHRMPPRQPGRRCPRFGANVACLLPCPAAMETLRAIAAASGAAEVEAADAIAAARGGRLPLMIRRGRIALAMPWCGELNRRPRDGDG